MRYRIIIYIKAGYAPLNESVHPTVRIVLKVPLNTPKSALWGRPTLKYYIFLKNLCDHPIVIFFTSGSKVSCMENGVVFIVM